MSASETVARRFADYLERCQPTKTVAAVAAERTKGIQAALLRSVEIARVARVGSFYKGTAIHNASDLDFFVVLRRDSVRRAGQYVASTTILNNLRTAISDRYPRSVVGRDQSAIVISFSTGIPIDVVPAVYLGPLPSGHPLYQIPDGEGGWRETSPDAQGAAFAAADEKSSSKLRRCVQLVKAWARYRQLPLPLSSFYVESVLAAAEVANGVRSYSAVLADGFTTLANRGAAAFRDPLGVSGYIHATRTVAQRDTLVSSLNYAFEHSDAAYEAEYAGDSREAVRQWRILFPGFRTL